MRSYVTPGGVFPDYELPDHEDVPRRLSELQGDDLLILTLARGHYCPKEHQQHVELAAFYRVDVARGEGELVLGRDIWRAQLRIALFGEDERAART